MAVIRSIDAPTVLDTTIASPVFRSARVMFGLRSTICWKSGVAAVPPAGPPVGAAPAAGGAAGFGAATVIAHSGWIRAAIIRASWGCSLRMLESLLTLTVTGFFVSML